MKVQKLACSKEIVSEPTEHNTQSNTHEHSMQFYTTDHRLGGNQK